MRGFSALMMVALLALTTGARAQDTTGAQTTTGSGSEAGAGSETGSGSEAGAGTGSGSEAGSGSGSGSEASSGSTESAAAQTEEVVPPIMVAALATGRVPPEVPVALRTALVELITPMAGGRPVLPLAHEGVQAAIAACADAACLGAQLAQAGTIGAVIARVSRTRPRGPYEVSVDIVDPISGASRLSAPLAAQLGETQAAAEIIAPMGAALQPVMFSPPPPPPQLLVTVNVDGATVRVDDQVIGESPVAPVRLTRGRHVVMVTLLGYSGVRREIELEPGESERVDITLNPSSITARDGEPAYGGGSSGEAASGGEWYEQWYVWAGIGGGLVVIGVIVGVAVATSSSGPTPDPMGIALPPIE